MKLFLLLPLVVLFAGCAVVDQNVASKLEEKTTWYPDGRVEVVKQSHDTTENKNYVSGSAKQIVEKTRLSNAAKSQSIGTSGVSQESTSPIKDATGFLHELNELTGKIPGAGKP